MSSPGFKAQELFNSDDIDGIAAIGTPDAKFVHGEEGELTLSWPGYVQLHKDVLASFPDLHFHWSESKELDDGTVTSKVYVTGTHTGSPFGFGPFPPIEATGIKCQNDPEDVQWIIEGDKIKETRVICGTKGSTKAGPPGFYVQIGGKME